MVTTRVVQGIFAMRDQIISFTEKRDFKKILFVIRDTHVSRDTWRASKQNLNVVKSLNQTIVTGGDKLGLPLNNWLTMHPNQF